MGRKATHMLFSIRCLAEVACFSFSTPPCDFPCLNTGPCVFGTSISHPHRRIIMSSLYTHICKIQIFLLRPRRLGINHRNGLLNLPASLCSAHLGLLFPLCDFPVSKQKFLSPGALETKIPARLPRRSLHPFVLPSLLFQTGHVRRGHESPSRGQVARSVCAAPL